MILNDVLAKQNVLTKLLLNDGEKELSRELKVKIMRIRMAYSKVKKNFDSEIQEFVDQLNTDEIKILSMKQNRTESEENRLLELNDKVNADYQEFIAQKVLEKVSDLEDSFTIDEYYDIVDVNSGNNVEINGTKIQAPDFLEIFYELFIKE